VSREAPSGGGGLSLQTLLISSVAAVAAAVVVPTFWERGSLIATAVTPIVVAIVSELLRKPTQVVTAVAPKVYRRTPNGTAVHTKETAAVGGRRRDAGAEQVAPVPPVPPGGISEDDPFGLRAAQRPRRRFPLRLAVITGLIAAVIGAGVVTASELTVFSHSVGSSHHRTSLFGGATKKSSKDSNTDKSSSSSKEKQGSQATATPTPTPTPTATATATPSATATAAATPSPSATPAPAPATGATASPTPTP
jgi:hypothetical protein